VCARVAVREDSRVVRRRVECVGFWVAEVGVGEVISCMVLYGRV